MPKARKCPCCKQSSNLRKTECVLCGAYAMTSRAQIRDGLHPCRCGQGELEPVCLMDRATCFPDVAYGREAWAEYAMRFPDWPDPVFSARAKRAAATRKRRQEWAAIRPASEPVMPF